MPFNRFKSRTQVLGLLYLTQRIEERALTPFCISIHPMTDSIALQPSTTSSNGIILRKPIFLSDGTEIHITHQKEGGGETYVTLHFLQSQRKGKLTRVTFFFFQFLLFSVHCSCFLCIYIYFSFFPLQLLCFYPTTAKDTDRHSSDMLVKSQND